LKSKILIVDDIRENILALQAIIASPELEIFHAEDADTALNLVFEHEFALALLDVQMPSLNGFELARLIRGVERSRHLPIIFVTAQDKGASIEFAGYEMGAVDLLFKPLDPHVVRSKVRVFVQLDKQSKELLEQIRTISNLREQAVDASLAKSRFLANMSHEIRTPLAAVLGFSELLAEPGTKDSERRRLWEAINRNGDLLMRVINDVLDLSKVEAQKLELTPTVFSLKDMIRDFELTLGHKAGEKGLKFKINYVPDGPDFFFADSTRVKQVLLNVIHNALKFTDHGAVTVDVHVRPSGELTELQVLVTDTGIGLDADQQSRLFQPFSQADSTTSKKFGGTGLGLVISKQLALQLGGDVTLVRSRQGEGSQFRVVFRIPRAVEETKSAGKSASQLDLKNALKGRRIMVVDDVVDNRELMEMFLEPTGAQIALAESGEEAIKLCRQNDQPEVILMDIQMPGMDGYMVTRELRANGFSRPIVALTAHAMKSEIDRCLDSGCDMVMTKPVNRGELIRTLSGLLSLN
jgi:signal transduction histidine kinase